VIESMRFGAALWEIKELTINVTHFPQAGSQEPAAKHSEPKICNVQMSSGQIE